MVTDVVLNQFHVGKFQASVLLANGGDVVLVSDNDGLGSGFRVILGNTIGSSFIGVDGLVFTNFCLYGDLISRGSVGSGAGSVRNMRRHRSLVQYRSNGVDRRGSSSLFIRAASSTRTAA